MLTKVPSSALPHPYGLILADGCHPLAVGAEGGENNASAVPLSVCSERPESVSQMRAVFAPAGVTRFMPSGLNDAACASGNRASSSVSTLRPVRASQIQGGRFPRASSPKCRECQAGYGFVVVSTRTPSGLITADEIQV